MAGKKSVLSSLAVYAEDSEPESDGEAGVETAGSAAGEARAGRREGRGEGGGKKQVFARNAAQSWREGKRRALCARYRAPEPHSAIRTLRGKNGSSPSAGSIILPKLIENLRAGHPARQRRGMDKGWRGSRAAETLPLLSERVGWESGE